jgi:hypothetical protein
LKDDRFYLLHILDCIQRIEADTAGGIDSFRASRTIQDAVIRNLQILAESSQRLSAQLKSRSSQVEWEPYRGVSQRTGPRLPGFGYGTHLGGSRPGCRGAQEINRIDLGRTALSPTVSAMKKAAPTSRPKERRSDTSVRNHLEAWISLRSLGRPRRHRLYPNIEKEPAFRQKLGRSHD